MSIFRLLLNWVRFSWTWIKNFKTNFWVTQCTNNMIQNEDLPSTLYSPVNISAHCQCTISNMTHNWCYPCCMVLCMWHKDFHPRETGSFLFVRQWTTRSRLVTLSCVKSLLRASFLAFCHLLKWKWTKISQKNQFTFAGIIPQTPRYHSWYDLG